MRRKFIVTDGHLLAAVLHPRYRSLRQFSFVTDERRAAVRRLLVAEATSDPVEAVEQEPESFSAGLQSSQQQVICTRY